MITYIKGTVFAKTNDAVIIENNDIGYEVRVTAPLWRKTTVGLTCACFTHEYIREDSRELFGFGTLAELRFFKRLISISGVGPKSALAVLSLGTLRDIETAVTHGNVSFLTAIPGIGQKTAQKIILELKGKLELTEGTPSDRETTEALESLGYSAAQAREALRHISPEITDVGDRIRAALKLLGQKVR